MKPNFTIPLVCAAAFAVTAFTAKAAETPISELLRDALYLEEVSRDADGAARQYAEVVSRYETQRNFAATALFRLAEVRRKQGRKDEAIALYQRLITEFPGAGTQIGLAQENLKALGGKVPSGAQEAAPDLETKFIAEYEQLRKTSPDVANRPIQLSLAVRNNFLRFAKHLLENGADPNVSYNEGGSNGLHTPLSLAASMGNLALCELLLDAGAKTETQGSLNPLSQPIFKGYPKVVELLLKRGANPNVDSESREESDYEGTPLAIASRYGSEAMVDKLLEAGADPNLAMPAKTGITPLHFAILYANEGVARKLVAAGARRDLPAKQEITARGAGLPPRDRQIKEGTTPLMACVTYGSQDLMELMASKATKEELSALLPYAFDSPKKFKWLLDKGADPNTKTAKGYPLLILTFGNPVIMRDLLAAGADPNVIYYDEGKSALNSEPSTPLRTTAGYGGETGIQLTRMLIDAGAKPDEQWMKRLLEGSHDSSATELLFERFVIPSLAGGSSVIAAIPTPNGIKSIEIATRETGTPPDDLAKLLLKPRNPIGWAKVSSQDLWPEQITVWRKAEGNAKAFWKGRMTGAAEFPKLQWGDVVQFSFDTPVDGRALSIYYNSNESNLPHALHWALRKRISFPIQVEVDGKTRDYQMRGDRIAFDPTRPELPLVESERLAKLLCPGSSKVEIAIYRKDLPEIRTTTTESSGSVIFEAHDKVKLTSSDSAETTRKRKDRIAVKATGLPLSRTYVSHKEILAPTLIHVLADILSYQRGLSERDSPEASKMVEWLLQEKSYITPVLWINPDLSKIRIHRIGEGDSESTIEINLAERIAASSGKTLTNDTAGADIPLQRGDIVEVTLKGDPDNSWTGLSAREAEFFGKVLNCRVQVTDKQRKVSVNQLIFSPLNYVKTEAGKLPVRSGESEMEISTLTPYSTFGYSRPTVIRDGVSFGGQPGDSVFLEEGDQISSDETIQPIRRSTPTPSGPRPRVTPSSPSR